MRLFIFFVNGHPHYYDLEKQDRRVKGGWRFWSYTIPIQTEGSNEN